MPPGSQIPSKPRGDVDPVAHQVAVALLDDVAEMNADAKLDAAFGRQAGVALDHAGLHLERATHGVHHTAELDDRAVAGAFDDAAAMGGYCGVDEVAAEAPQARKRAILVRSREPAVAYDIRNQNRRELPGLAHRAPPVSGSVAQKLIDPILDYSWGQKRSTLIALRSRIDCSWRATYALSQSVMARLVQD